MILISRFVKNKTELLDLIDNIASELKKEIVHFDDLDNEFQQFSDEFDKILDEAEASLPS